MKRFGLAVAGLLLILSGALSGCALQQLPLVPLDAEPPAARPELAPVDGPSWRAEALSSLRPVFEAEIYGEMPPVRTPARLEREALTSRLSIEAIAERWEIEVAPEITLNAALFLPEGEGPHPVIVIQTFCNLGVATAQAAAWTGPVMGACGEGGGFEGWAATTIFGEFIMGPPYEQLLARGYGVAIIYPGEVAPDYAEGARPALDRLAAALGADTQWGVIAAWAWLYSSMDRILGADPRIDGDRIAAWGHSRNGKSAILAAAFDTEIDAVLSLQSGTGGATLNRSHNGETIGQITETYPHWFAAAYAGWDGREADMPVDQHQLLALIAPRPVLIGNARRDQWSDPQGAWAAAQGADPAWEAHGTAGLDQTGYVELNPEAPLAFYMRNGLHGVHQQDWDAALDFLDAQWGAPVHP